jgi:hypothetical protein
LGKKFCGTQNTNCELNPIEGLWCHSKHYVRKNNDQDYSKLNNLICESFENFKIKNVNIQLWNRFWRAIEMYEGILNKNKLVCKYLNTCAGRCRPVPVGASLCRSVPACAGLCRSVQACAGRCKPVPVGASLCRSVQACAGRCRHRPAGDFYFVCAGRCRCRLVPVWAGRCR